MFSTFDSTSANEAWLQAARYFGQNDSLPSQPGRMGDTIEMLHVGISISDPVQRWVISRTPPINPAFALAEVVWILAGRDDSRFLNYFNSRLPKYAGATLTYPGAYGFRLRHHHGIDQLTRAYEALRKNPTTRQVVLQIWDANVDLPDMSGSPASADVPCNITSVLKIRKGKLEWLQIMRSNDLMLGLPYNLVQFTSLQEILAGWLGVKVGSYNHITDSLHVYSSVTQWLDNSKSLETAPNTDSLALSKQESEAAFAILEHACEDIIDPKNSADDLREISMNLELPIAFRNILLVLCAEGARKRKCKASSDDLIAECTNPAFVQLWDRWTSRMGVRSLPRESVS